MKNKICKIFGNIWVFFSILLMMWVGLSWIDVIADNSTIANHNKYNFFYILSEMADTGKVDAIVIESNNGFVTLFDEDGEEWFYEAKTTEYFLVGEQVEIKFSKQGTETLYDDEIISVSKI